MRVKRRVSEKTTGGMKIIILNEKIKEKMLEIIKNIKKKK